MSLLTDLETLDITGNGEIGGLSCPAWHRSSSARMIGGEECGSLWIKRGERMSVRVRAFEGPGEEIGAKSCSGCKGDDEWNMCPRGVHHLYLGPGHSSPISRPCVVYVDPGLR